MPISPTGRANKRPATAGFTLVELLVVVTIVAILALGVGLTGGGVFARGGAAPGALSRALQDAVRSARDQAVLGRMPVGLRPRSDGWIVARSDGTGRWPALGRPVVARGAALSWRIGDERYLPALAEPLPGGRPPVVFRPDGGGNAFAVTFSEAGQRRVCRFDGWGPVECE